VSSARRPPETVGGASPRNFTKSALAAAQVRAAVEARLGAVSGFAPLPEGLVSQVFGFERGGEAFVVRVGRERAGYEKDAFVARSFARPALAIPEVVAIEAAGEALTFCVSRRAPGMRVQALDEAGATRVAPAILDALAEIGRSDTAAVTGVGRFDAAGRAPWATWRDYLLRFHPDADAWTARLPADDAALMRRALALVEQLLPAREPARRLIHGDFGSANLIADGAAVSAVIDWDLAAIGDALYDVANLLFWREARLSAVCDALRREHGGDPARRRTLAGYQLRIGVEEVREVVARGASVDLGWLLARVRELVAETYED
jgi:hygromycin-B 4-O-kinase